MTTERTAMSAPAAPAARRRIGVSAPASALGLSTLRKLGLTRVRMEINWNNYLDTRHFADDRSTPVGSGGHTVPEIFAMDLAAFESAGIEVLVVVHTPPAGMTLATGITAMPAFMAARATEFPGRRWQIMNEMDGANPDSFNANWFHAEDTGYTQAQRGDLYGQLLGPVYDAIKSADPTAIVVAGGIALDPAAFWTAVAARCPGKYDAAAVHCYGSPTASVFAAKSVAMRAVLGGLPLYCTEFGNNQGAEVTQASDIGQMLDDNDKNTRYDRAYLYTLIEDGDGYGVARSDGSFRHAALLLRDRTAG